MATYCLTVLKARSSKSMRQPVHPLRQHASLPLPSFQRGHGTLAFLGLGLFHSYVASAILAFSVCLRPGVLLLQGHQSCWIMT